MRAGRSRGVVLGVALVALLAGLGTGLPPIVHAESYKVQTFPLYSQEGSSITLVLTVSGASPTTPYEFNFTVQDPANANCTSTIQRPPSPQTEFSITTTFPGNQFSAFCSPTSLVGTYKVYVDQVLPVFRSDVAPGVAFYIGLVDSLSYERTQTAHIQATGYSPGESASVSVWTTLNPLNPTLVFMDSQTASFLGVINSYWKIPRNATVEAYLVTVSGTFTAKSPSDAQPFFVQAAHMAIASLSSAKSSYQRTETLYFSFQPSYPDSSLANTGGALVTLTRPDRTNVTLTANYEADSQRFVARYKTSTTNQTGIWTASLATRGFDDGNGNIGPPTTLSSSPQLRAAALSVSIASQTSFALNQQIRFNVTIQYPDGTNLQSGSVSSSLVFSEGGHNDSVPIVFDSTLKVWVGSYSLGPNEPGGLWSLSVSGSDSAVAPNSGSATRAITLQASPSSGNATLPLYYFGILAAIIAAMLGGGFAYFRRHRVTHANLKIDLEAVKTEAGRIENNEFFQSVKEQLRKEKDD